MKAVAGDNLQVTRTPSMERVSLRWFPNVWLPASVAERGVQRLAIDGVPLRVYLFRYHEARHEARGVGVRSKLQRQPNLAKQQIERQPKVALLNRFPVKQSPVK